MKITGTIPGLTMISGLKERQDKIAKALQKLSTGLRISQAGDDAAGLTISEGMKAQIRGLYQAQRNIQDGVSLLQTIEGALSVIQEVHLQRLRELAIYAANGTLSTEDRAKLQDEVEQVKKGIDDIAHHTQFNKIKVLSPPTQLSNSTSAGGRADIVFIVDISASMGSYIDNVIANLDGFIERITSSGVDFSLGLVSYSDTSAGEPITKWGFTSDGAAFKNNMITMRSHMLAGGDINESGLEAIKDSSNGALSLPLRTNSTKQFILITDAPVHDNAMDGDSGDGLSVYDIDDVAAELAASNIKLTVVGPLTGQPNTQLKRLSEPTGGGYLNISGSFSAQLDGLAGQIAADAGETVEEPITLYLQVGANAGQTYPIKLFDARTEKLGIEDIAVDSPPKAVEAIDKIDAAMSRVLSERTRFGVCQNALEHVEHNSANYAENLVTAESRIKDADMAKEVMELMKANICRNASQAVLIQAKQTSEGILRLLR